jgi:hypothetical protein
MLDRGEHPLAEFGILFPKIRDNRHIVRSGIQFLIHEFPQKFPRAETYRARRRFCDPLAQSKRQGKHNGNFWAKSARWARQALGALNQPALQGLPIHGAGDVRYLRRTGRQCFDAVMQPIDPNRTMWALICCSAQLLC